MPGSIIRNRLREEHQTPDENIERSEDRKSFVKISSVLSGHAVSPYSNGQEKGHAEIIILEQELENEDRRQDQRDENRENIQPILTKAVQVFLAILCAYLVFLIYGVLKTDYVYGASGEAEPLVRTVEDILLENEFSTMKTQYLQARTLYECVLLLDYRLGSGIEDPLLIAPEYEKSLEDISKLSVQIGALTVPAQYAQTMNMLLSWVQNDIALYCQYISRAITQNIVSDMEKALQYKDIMYNDFKQITQVCATLGASVPNADITDIVQWSPERYIEQYRGDID